MVDNSQENRMCSAYDCNFHYFSIPASAGEEALVRRGAQPLDQRERSEKPDADEILTAALTPFVHTKTEPCERKASRTRAGRIAAKLRPDSVTAKAFYFFFNHTWIGKQKKAVTTRKA